MEEGRSGRRTWLNVLLFLITCFSTFFVGLTWSVSYNFADELVRDPGFAPAPEVFFDPRIIGLGLVYAMVLIAILSGHEMGHYLTCRYYRIEATLPYFIPAPGLIGTLGAFIRIRSSITRKKQLFDISVSGPLTGFFLALPALIVGLSLSKVVPSIPREGTLFFGEPLLLKLIGAIIFRDLPAQSDLFLHPIGFAGWVGILVTAFNLFPVGQLDGGHIAYALIGQKSRPLARILIAVFFIMGMFFWVGWIVWGLVIILLGLKHPRITEETERLSLGRRWLGMIMVIIFVLSFIPAPIKGYSLIELVAPWMA